MAGKILGAVIAGGASRRFGSDKALALIGGQPMLAHVIEALRPQVDDIVICGRGWPGVHMLADRRAGRIGPLAGLEAALHHAVEHGFRAILSAPVDTLPLPRDLVARLEGPGPAVLNDQYLIGLWPVACLKALHRHLASGARSFRGWMAAAEARTVAEPFPIGNINVPGDLPRGLETTWSIATDGQQASRQERRA